MVDDRINWKHGDPIQRGKGGENLLYQKLNISYSQGLFKPIMAADRYKNCHQVLDRFERVYTKSSSW